MGLFSKVHLNTDEIERALNRPLTGDPSRGERGALAALRADRLDEVRRLLERDATLGPDFKELVGARLAQATRGRETVRAWRVQLPVDVWSEYARESATTHVPLADCLAAAIQRDFDRRRQSMDPVDALDSRVRAYHAAATTILEELKRGADGVSAFREVLQALRRLEDAVGRNPAGAGRR